MFMDALLAPPTLTQEQLYDRDKAADIFIPGHTDISITVGTCNMIILHLHAMLSLNFHVLTKKLICILQKLFCSKGLGITYKCHTEDVLLLFASYSFLYLPLLSL